MLRTMFFPDAIFAVHLDHGDEEACFDCIESGFYSSVMIDASHEPYEKNIEITKRIVDAAHAKGIVVEAELGQLGGVEEHVSVSEENAKLTNPDQAKDFVDRTGCDSSGRRHWHQPWRFQIQRFTITCILMFLNKSRKNYPVSRWSCMAQVQFRRKKLNASIMPAARSWAPKAWMQPNSRKPLSWV